MSGVSAQTVMCKRNAFFFIVRNECKEVHKNIFSLCKREVNNLVFIEIVSLISFVIINSVVYFAGAYWSCFSLLCGSCNGVMSIVDLEMPLSKDSARPLEHTIVSSSHRQ